MSTISGTLTTGTFLGTGYASPLTITPTGYINAGTAGKGGAGNGAAVYAAQGGPSVVTLVNQGRIRAAGTVRGVFKGTVGGLSINNSGTISAAADAIALQRGGPVT